VRGDVPNRLVVSSRDSPMTPPPSVGNGIIRVERIRTRARAGPRARDDRDDRVRLVDDRAADVASERSSSRVESSRVESSRARDSGLEAPAPSANRAVGERRSRR